MVMRTRSPVEGVLALCDIFMDVRQYPSYDSTNSELRRQYILIFHNILYIVLKNTHSYIFTISIHISYISIDIATQTQYPQALLQVTKTELSKQLFYIDIY